jgi:hypothetical protein
MPNYAKQGPGFGLFLPRSTYLPKLITLKSTRLQMLQIRSFLGKSTGFFPKSTQYHARCISPQYFPSFTGYWNQITSRSKIKDLEGMLSKTHALNQDQNYGLWEGRTNKDTSTEQRSEAAQ